jgi:hypothetical protein
MSVHPIAPHVDLPINPIENAHTFTKSGEISSNVTFQDSFAPAVIDTRPQVDKPQKVNRGILGLIGVVDQIEEMKKELQQANSEEVDRLSNCVKDIEKKMHEATLEQKSAKRLEKYLKIAHGLTVFASAAYTLLNTRNWENMGTTQKALASAALVFSTLNVAAITLEQLELLEINYQNLLTALQLISIASLSASIHYEQQAANLLQKIVETSAQIIAVICGIEEGKANYKTRKIENENLQFQQQMRKIQNDLQAVMNDMLIVEKRTQIEVKVANIIHELQEITRQIQRPY